MMEILCAMVTMLTKSFESKGNMVCLSIFAYGAYKKIQVPQKKFAGVFPKCFEGTMKASIFVLGTGG